ncbi:MAG: nucleoside recognition domain-containing protein [Tissierellaceae bacterium]|nr:nucleoside recognition domain-containing protein [Tissierellaceae bacterium]
MSMESKGSIAKVNENLKLKQSIKSSQHNMPKFITGSLIGIIVFFIPVYKGMVPLVLIVNFLKSVMSGVVDFLVLALIAALVITYTAGKFFGVERCKEYHKQDGKIKGALYLIALVFSILIITNTGPDYLLSEDVGGLAYSLAGSVMVTVIVAGSFVVFLLKSGVIEFIGTFMEPIMRPLFKLPGTAAVDALASFVSAAAVGIFLTNQLYLEGQYTNKEAKMIMTNFSVCSLGFFGVLLSIVGQEQLYPIVVLTSLVVTFILAAIVIRIPPVSRYSKVYHSGREQTEADTRVIREGSIHLRALDNGLKVGKDLSFKDIRDNLWDTVVFTQKIVAYVVALATIVLILAEFTPIFMWLGKPMIPYLKLVGMPNAAEIAPSTLIGFAEIALPVMLIAGKGIALKSVFFITVLSTVQIIFFTESGNAMLETDVGFNFFELLGLFLIRTVIAIPLVAIAAHILF